MPIVKPLHARVYWLFQGGASFVDPFLSFMFMLVFVMPSFLFLAALWSPNGRGGLLDLLCVVFPCVFVAFPCGVPGRVWCLVVSIPDICLLLYFE